MIISLVTLFGIWAGWLANDAVADYRVSTLWAEKDNDPKEIASIKQQLSDMKTDVAVIKESTSWIK